MIPKGPNNLPLNTFNSSTGAMSAVGLSDVRQAIGLNPETGKPVDRYEGILPTKVSDAQKGFGLANLVDRGSKFIFDMFKGHGKYVNGQMAFVGETAQDPFSESLRVMLHGEGSPFTWTLPEELRHAPLSHDAEKSGMELSAQYEAWNGWGKAASYMLTVSTTIMGLMHARKIADDFHRQHATQKLGGLLVQTGGFLAEKVANIGVFYLMASGDYSNAALLLMGARVVEIIGFSGSMYAAGPTVRDTHHEHEVKQVRETVKIALKALNKAEKQTKKSIIDQLGPRYKKAIAHLEPILFGIVESEAKHIISEEPRYNKWLRRLPFKKSQPDIGDKLSVAAIQSVRLYSELRQIDQDYQDRMNSILSDDTIDSNAAFKTESAKAKNKLTLKLQQLKSLLEEQLTKLSNNKANATPADIKSTQKLISGVNHALNILHDANLLADPKKSWELEEKVDQAREHVFDIAEKTMADSHDLVIQISRRRKPLQRSIIEKAFHLSETWNSSTHRIDIISDILDHEENIDRHIDNLQIKTAEAISEIKGIRQHIKGKKVREKDSADAIQEQLHLTKDAGRINLAEIGAANSRLYDSIPKAVQAAAFLGIGAFIYSTGGEDAVEICKIIKGGQELPLLLVGAIGLVTATGPFLSLKKAISARRKAIENEKNSDKTLASISILSEGIKMPASMLIAHPITNPVGIGLYATGVGIESLGLAFPHRKKWAWYRKLSKRFNLDD